ncbi:MAG: cytochrome c [Bacteroidia bacterium]|nr:cytochrome c [Bacteroidia bacterium]NNF30538.1 cytochrome c [Flavobacteriaceae bacterium]MBT8277128.1 cytochrome c [Bacteroidia bacterium]NNJ81052.1 cytochrome c [Flavobacteriaceae bacterium]NNK53885.1 cytochrome c [Flavobacteriaceae bacterium]
MKKAIHISIVIIASLAMVSCFDSNSPNYQYMNNMYEPVGYETYGEYEIFENEMEAKLPAEGSIPRGWMPYEYENSTAGLEQARAELKMTLPVTEEHLERGEELYEIYCAVCHGTKGDGQGILMQREKFLGIPSYADPGRNITEGSIYHVQMYGLNSMGSYASQTNELERWQITQHVMNLMAALKGEPALELSSDSEGEAEVAGDMTEGEAETVETEETN